MGDQLNGIFDLYFIKPTKKEITSFLNQVSKIPFQQSKTWETLLIKFFREPCVIAIIERTIEDEDTLFELIKKDYFESFQSNKVIIWDSETLFKTLNEINETIKIQPSQIKKFSHFFFHNFIVCRKAFQKQIDSIDSSFENYGGKIIPFCKEFTTLNDKKFYQNIYFICSDKTLRIDPQELGSQIEKDFAENLNRKLIPSNNKNKRSPLDSHLRHECFKRDNYACKECGITNKETILHVDHILPISQGGEDSLDNLQTLCEKCNLAKSNKKWRGGNGID